MDSDWVTNRSSDLSSGPPHPTGTGTPSHGLLSGAGRRGSLSQARERERERERESPEQEEEEEEGFIRIHRILWRDPGRPLLN